MQAAMESGRFVVVPRDNTAEPLLPLDITVGHRRKIRSKNFTPDFFTLMRAMIVVVRQPF